MSDDLLTELGAKLISGSLTDEALMAESGRNPSVRILPDKPTRTVPETRPASPTPLPAVSC